MREWTAANREHIREYREATKDQRNARRRELYHSDPERREAIKECVKEYKRNNRLRRRVRQYGITEEAYELMENEGCAICGAHPHVDASVKMHIDHDHKTGKVRGVLCQSCNLAIGHINDDPMIAVRIAQYLMGARNE